MTAISRDNSAIPAEAFARLRTPVGLDLGGGSPAEVAVAIIAEIVACRNERSGMALTDRHDAIHAPASHEICELSSSKTRHIDTVSVSVTDAADVG